MKVYRLILAAGLLSGAAVHAQAAANWSAHIGTGHVSEGRSVLLQPLSPTPTSSPAPAPWTAFIGTGHVRYGSPAFDAQQSMPARMPNSGAQSAPWSAFIGTGRAGADAISPPRSSSN
jgi:hypothetical protein